MDFNQEIYPIPPTVEAELSRYLQDELSRMQLQIFTLNELRYLQAQSVTSTPTAISATNDLVVCNSVVATIVTLDNATGSGRRIFIKNINTGVVTVTPLATGTADTIDGETTQTLGQWDCIEICDYADDKWVII